MRIIRTERTRELWLGDRRIFLTTIGDDWGECSKEQAEREMQKALEEHSR